MNKFKLLLSIAVLTLVPAVFAAEVVRESVDHTAGGAFGGLSGLIIGGAASGGPVGALLGGVVGILAGKFVQEKAGMGERAYDVSTDDGRMLKIRSPNKVFEPGDEVLVEGNRLHKTD